MRNADCGAELKGKKHIEEGRRQKSTKGSKFQIAKISNQ
jgi:hypothetical protein